MKRPLVSIAARCSCAALLSLPSLASADPPAAPFQFANDAQHTGRSHVRGPRRAPAIRWRVRSQRRVFASPSFDPNGRVVFSGIDGLVHAVDLDGVERWAFNAAHPVFATPASIPGFTLVAHDGGALVALDARGSTRWSVRTPEDADAPPALGPDGTVYLAAGLVHAINPDGTLRWSTPTQSHSFGAPALSPDGRSLYVTDVRGELLTLETARGAITRRTPLGAPAYGAPLVLGDGTVVVGSNDGHVRAFAPDGTRRWDAATRDEVRSTPALGTDGTIWVGSDDGGIYALNPTDGTVRIRVNTSGRVRASVRVDRDGYLYVGSEDDSLYALDPTGSIAWTLPLGADIDSSALLVRDGELAVGCDDGALYLIGEGPQS